MRCLNFLIVAFFLLSVPVTADARLKKQDKARVIVTTDLGGADPDDIQSMIHLLLCSDMVDIEGFVSSQTWVDLPDNSSLIKHYIDEYAKVYDKLAIHSSGFPSPDYLKSVTVFGQQKSNMDSVGEGYDSAGSDLMIKTVDEKGDDRPVWILGWGGMNTLAQALWKVSHTRKADEVERFVSKIRVYDILGQDDAGAWIARNYPELRYIRNTEVYGWAPSDEWVAANIQCHTPFGKAYPNRIWATEGDSPAFLYLLANGLNVPEHPEYGGWGGRFDLEEKAGIRGMSFIKSSGKDETQHDPYYMIGSSSEGVNAINRWRDGIWNNFAARMQWTLTDNYSEVNHHPVAALGRDHRTDCIYMTARCGEKLKLNASASSDPDGDELIFKWSIYYEPGTYKDVIKLEGSASSECLVHVPDDASGKNFHVILEVNDNGTPSLTSYRRVVVQIK